MSICPFCDPDESYRVLTVEGGMCVIYPKNPVITGHFLITPVGHIEQWHMLSPKQYTEAGVLLGLLQDKVSEVLTNYIGYNLQSNNGSELVNQRVKHAHMHVFMRTKDDPNPFTVSHTGMILLFTNKQLLFIEEMKQLLN